MFVYFSFFFYFQIDIALMQNEKGSSLLKGASAMEKMKALVDMCRSQNPSLQVRFAIFHPQLRYFRYKHIHSLASKVI